jgi:Xaa-Pro aminopeptidase
VIRRPEQDRRARLMQIMSENGFDSLLVTRREDVRYLSGFTGSSGSLLIASGRSCLITDFRYNVQARRETTGITIQIQKKDHFTAVRDAGRRLGIDTLWFDESALTIEGLKKFKQKGLKLRGHADLVRTLRQQKDKRELAHIRLAIHRAEEAFRELKADIKPGATEQGLGLKLEYLMRGKGARRAAFDIIVASGAHGAMPHASVTNRRIRKGDLVTFDFGAEANGYYSDMTRTVCVGRPSVRQREIHELVLRAQSAAIQSISIGVPCKSIDAAAREVIKKGGHGRNFGHGTGHGIGLMVHEGPSVSPLSKDMIEENMVFTVEPGVYMPGWGGVRIEDMVQVTKKGAKVLTTLPRELESLRSL